MIIMKIIGAVVIIMVLIDIMGWATGGTYDGSASAFIMDIATAVTSFPSQILCFVFNFIGQIINVAVALVFGIIPGLPSPPTINLGCP